MNVVSHVDSDNGNNNVTMNIISGGDNGKWWSQHSVSRTGCQAVSVEFFFIDLMVELSRFLDLFYITRIPDSSVDSSGGGGGNNRASVRNKRQCL